MIKRVMLEALFSFIQKYYPSNCLLVRLSYKQVETLSMAISSNIPKQYSSLERLIEVPTPAHGE